MDRLGVAYCHSLPYLFSGLHESIATHRAADFSWAAVSGCLSATNRCSSKRSTRCSSCTTYFSAMLLDVLNLSIWVLLGVAFSAAARGQTASVWHRKSSVLCPCCWLRVGRNFRSLPIIEPFEFDSRCGTSRKTPSICLSMFHPKSSPADRFRVATELKYVVFVVGFLSGKSPEVRQ